jgi:fibronectin type 3 domain-containing protein
MRTSWMHITVVCLTLAAAGSSVGQQKRAAGSQRVLSGKDGVYLFLGKEILHPERPVKGFVGYNVYRKSAGGEYRKLNEQPVSRVNTEREFESALGPETLSELAQYFKLGDPAKVWVYVAAHSDSAGKLGLALLNKDLLREIGLLYVDREVEPGATYEYAVAKIRGDKTESAREQFGKVLVGSIPSMPRLKLEVISASDTGITLRILMPRNKTIYGCRIYRKQFGEPFAKAGDDIHAGSGEADMSTSFIDKNVPPRAVFYYFAEPFDFVDNAGVPSDTLEVFTYDFNGIATALDLVAAGTQGGVRLSWSALRDDFVIQYLSVEHSRNEKEGFVEVAGIAPTDTTFIDGGAIPAMPNYYRIVSVGIDGKTKKYSATVSGLPFNSVAPAPPHSVTAGYARGGVLLSWERSPETDVAGYFVYRSTGERDTLEQVSPLIRQTPKDTLYTFTDTSSSVSSKAEYWYFIEAENTSQQKSDLSQPVKIKGSIYDLAAVPEPPLGISGYVDTDGIRLVWEDATAVDNGVAGYVVYREKAGAKGEPERIADSMVPAEWHMFLDRTAAQGVQYEYSVASVNINNVEGKRSNPFLIKRDVRPPIPPAGVQVRQTSKGVVVQWGRSLQPEILGYHVYRAGVGKARERVANRVTGTEFLDPVPVKGELYRYTVTAVSKDRGESLPSEEVTVRR